MKIKIGFLLIVVTTLWAYINSPLDSAPSTIKKETTFLGIEQYFEEEIKRHEQQQTKLKKKITRLQSQEEQLIDSIDWQKELALFGTSSIIKPTWRDKYRVDSTIEGETLHVEYKALDEKMKTQKIDVDWYQNEIKSIVIVNNSNNQIYQAQEILTYIPSQGYTISKKQRVQLMSPSDYLIDATFVSKTK